MRSFSKAAVVLIAFAAMHSANGTDLARNVQWFNPYFYKEPLKNEAYLVVYGKTLPRTTVVVDPKQVFELENAGQTPDPDKNKDKINSTISNNTGCFQLQLKLPYGMVQVPFTFHNRENRATIVLTINMASDSARINAMVSPSEPPIIEAWRSELRAYLQNRLGIEPPVVQKISGLLFRLGIGGNVQAHQESASGTAIKFQTVSFPSTSLGFSYIRPNWLANVGYLRTPGKAGAPSEPYTLDKSAYVWDWIGLEGGVGVFDDLGYRNRLYLTAGVQHYWEPFFSLNSGNVIKIERHQIDAATIGISFWKEVFENQLLESVLRYQIPFRSQASGESSISTSPDFAFDLSLAYLFKPRNQKFAFGGTWLAQWQQRRYHFLNQSSGQAQDGTQSLFHSTFLLTGAVFL